MLVLALESATELAGAALADDSGVLATAEVSGRRHGESLAPAVEFVCARAGVTLAEVDAVAVDVGPGLFTGLRVGVSMAKGLAFGLSVPVVVVGSLELLATAMAGALAPGAAVQFPLLAPVIDARRSLVFSGRFEVTGGGAGLARVGDDRLFDPIELAEELAAVIDGGQPVVAFGDGARRYRADLDSAGVRGVGSVVAPDAGVLATMGVTLAASGAGVPAAQVTANYLRPADVRIKWERRMTAPAGRQAAGA